MRYFATPSTPLVRDAMRRGLIGAITTPAQGNRIDEALHWCADNGCFGNGYPGDTGFLAWLSAYRREGCQFAVAPDVPFDMDATLRRSRPMLRRIRQLGFPAALAAQNGACCARHLPWDEFDVLFLGGDTEWKLGYTARALTAEAHQRGKPVHMGRVNSLRRLRYAGAIGCDTADGTYLAFGPDGNLPKLLGWLRDVNDQGVLYVLDGA